MIKSKNKIIEKKVIMTKPKDDKYNLLFMKISILEEELKKINQITQKLELDCEF